MTHAQFEELVEIMSPFIKKQDIKLRNAIPIEKKMGIVLHQLYQRLGSTYRIDNYFGISAVTVIIFIIDVYQTLVNHFYNTYIKIPDDETLQKIMKGFENLTKTLYM